MLGARPHRRSASASCRGRKAALQFRDRVAVPAPCRRRRMARSLRRGSRAQRRRLAGAAARRQDRAQRIWRRRIVRRRRTICCRGICAAGSTPKRRRISPRRPARSVPIDYEAEQGPTELASACRNCSASRAHPAIAGGRVPLVIELLSPAHRPVQVTRDLPGFWRGSYAAGESRDARPLSAPSLAGRSACRAGDAPRQARAATKQVRWAAFNPSLTIAQPPKPPLRRHLARMRSSLPKRAGLHASDFHLRRRAADRRRLCRPLRRPSVLEAPRAAAVARSSRRARRPPRPAHAWCCRATAPAISRSTRASMGARSASWSIPALRW